MATIVDVNVTINITHTNDEDLDIFLMLPTARDRASTDNGNGGDNYTNTIFDDAAGISITAASPPFTGTFRPEEPLSQPQRQTGRRHLDAAHHRRHDATSNWASSSTGRLNVPDAADGGDRHGRAEHAAIWICSTTPAGTTTTTSPRTPRPMVSMTTTDPNIAFAQLSVHRQFEVPHLRPVPEQCPGSADLRLGLDAVADAFMTPGDMFTALHAA